MAIAAALPVTPEIAIDLLFLNKTSCVLHFIFEFPVEI